MGAAFWLVAALLVFASLLALPLVPHDAPMASSRKAPAAANHQLPVTACQPMALA